MKRKGLIYKRLAESLHTCVVKFCDATGDTQQDLADEIRLPLSTLNNILCGHMVPDAGVLVQLVRLTGDTTPIQMMCGLCNGLYVPMPRAEDEADLSEVLTEMGELIKQHAASLENDGVIDQDESAALHETGHKLVAAVMAYLERVTAAAVPAKQGRLRLVD